jgi:hypothetical protein
MLYSCCANLRSQLLQFCVLHFCACCLSDTFKYKVTVTVVDSAVVT